jgi:hypothetical protein
MDNETMKRAKTYVEVVAGMEATHRIGFFSELLKRGECFEGRTPVKSHPATKAWAKREKPKPKMCFMNAQRFVLDHPDAKYYEGYWSAFVIPVHHGWVVLDGKVYDFTAEAADHSLKRENRNLKHESDPTTEDYIGVHIPTEYITKSILKSKMWSDILGEWLIDELKKEGK